MSEPKWPTWADFQKLPASAQAFFKNDGCTAVPDLDIGSCCIEHDYYYMTKEVTRAEADKKFRQCIAKRYKLLPWIYWLGVRFFGSKFYGHNKRQPLEIATSDHPNP